MNRLCLFALTLFSLTLFKAQALPLETQRELFQAAEHAAKRGKKTAYKNTIRRISDYPLVPYAELAYLKKRPYLANKKPIQAFLNLYAGTPLEWPLRKPWLQHLAGKKQYKLFIEDYRPTDNAKLQCLHINAQLLTGTSLDELADDIKALWVVGHSQPQECDSLFKQWNAAGYRQLDDIKQRIILAATEGKHTLLPYLIGLLPNELTYWGQLWKKLRRDPAQVANLKNFKHFNQDESELFVYGVNRLIWRAPEKALATWQTGQNKFNLTTKQRLTVYKRFALALASKGNETALRYFKLIPPDQLDDQLTHWHLAILLKQQNWSQVVSFIQSLPQDKAQELGYQYWLSRSQQLLGIKQLARNRLIKIAKERHYYGFLASAQVNQLTKLNNYPYQAHYKVLNDLKNAPAAKRAFELLQLGRITQARREWGHFKRSLTLEEKAAAALIANEWDWHDQALRTISQAGYNDDVRLRFPLAFKNEFNANARRNNLPLSLTFAIARRESTFMSDARSSVGASGLMQLMPGTAKQVAGKKVSSHQLLDPKTNIKLGTKYLSRLLERTDGNLPLAIASYNAGYSRVIKWVPTDEPVEFDLWVETIPYKETREYVKSVLAYQQVYEHLLGNKQNLFSPLAKSQFMMVK